MWWIALMVAAILLYVLVVWPLTRGRRFFTPSATRRARDITNQVYAGRPDDGLTNVPFDPVVRDASLTHPVGDVDVADDSGEGSAR
jgi:hypothetical protein